MGTLDWTPGPAFPTCFRVICGRLGFRLAILWFLGLAGMTGGLRGELTSIDEVRALSHAEAAKALPVVVRGVVTFCNRSISTLFIHDGRSGIYVEQHADPDAEWPEVGTEIEVRGVTEHGVFSPVVSGPAETRPEIRILGNPGVPPPKKVDGAALAEPRIDCDWVEVDADVNEVIMDGHHLVLLCRAGSCEFDVQLTGPVPASAVPWDLAESRARIRGVAATIFNSNHQMTRRFLRVNSPADVVPLHPPEPRREARMVESSQLLRIDGPGPGDFVTIRGMVTSVNVGRGMFLRTGGGGIWVQTARGPKVSPGTMVEADGWPRAGNMIPFLRASEVRVIGQRPPPAPVSRKASQLLDARFESQFVSCEAELINTYRGVDGTTFELRDGGFVFRGWLDLVDGVPRELRPGSLVRVNGIVQIATSGIFNPLREEDKLLLRMRSTEDMVMLKPPPWWTPQRMTWSFTAALLVLAAFYQRGRLRRRRKAETQRREYEAVVAERGRFAREIHDSLAQGLTSVSMQLECVRDRLDVAPQAARDHLETARELVRDSLREARRTIWNLRPLALGEANLASALQKFADDLTAGGAVVHRQQIEGTPRPLGRQQEEALLRIGQESLTNAVRHASARRIDVRLRFGDDWVTLVVKDDGCGFDVAGRLGKGYGLTGMRERVDALGGSLSIDSRAGEGTEVSVTFPT